MKHLSLLFISVFMLLSINTYGQNTYVGKIIGKGQPQLTQDPIVPCDMFWLKTTSGDYIISINSHWIICNGTFSVEGIVYMEGDDVEITGTLSSVGTDIYSVEHFSLEIESIKKLNPSQSVQKFLGKYNIHAYCTLDEDDPIWENYSEQHTYEIEIQTNYEENSNIQFYFDKHGIYDFVKAKVLNDNDFDILAQQFIGEYEGLDTYLIGYGNIKDDSIFMNYRVGVPNVFGTLVCDCKGKKINSMGIVNPSEFTTYYDATEQVIVIDETLQNQSLLFELVDMQGKVVIRTGTGNTASINVANLPSGVYLYRLLQNSQVIYYSKFLK